MPEQQNDWVAMAREVLETEINGLATVRENLGESFARAVALLRECSGRVVVAGIGKSGLVGRKIAATFSSTGTPAFFLHPVEGAHGDLGSIRKEDCLLLISNSGRTAELNAIIPTLRSLGGSLIAITGDVNSPMARMADCILNAGVPREACSLNLAPTASTTATLALGDALAICLMRAKSFTSADFSKFHPGGSLGQRLRLNIAELMHTRNLPVTNEESPVEEAIGILDEGGLGAVLLLNKQDQLSGIITDGDLRRLLRKGALNLADPASAIMIRGFRYGQDGQAAAELLDMMERSGITVLPVLDAGKKLLGVVHLHDLLGKGSLNFAEK